MVTKVYELINFPALILLYLSPATNALEKSYFHTNQTRFLYVGLSRFNASQTNAVCFVFGLLLYRPFSSRSFIVTVPFSLSQVGFLFPVKFTLWKAAVVTAEKTHDWLSSSWMPDSNGFAKNTKCDLSGAGQTLKDWSWFLTVAWINKRWRTLSASFMLSKGAYFDSSFLIHSSIFITVDKMAHSWDTCKILCYPLHSLWLIQSTAWEVLSVWALQ